MTIQNIKKQGVIRWASISLLLILTLGSAALAQVAITIAPEAKARLREQAKSEMINPRVKLEAVTSRGRVSTVEVTASRVRQTLAASRSVSQRQEAAETEAASPVYYPGKKPLGYSYGNWGAQWWQWGTSIPNVTSPLNDKTGDFAATGQHGKVWFLAGNGGGVDERVITIPADVSLLVPVLTAIYFDEGLEPGLTEEAMRAALDEFMSGATTLEVSLDHQPLPRRAMTRAQSEVFPTFFPENNLLAEIGVLKGVYPLSVADGYYLMLKPLSSGTHVLKIRGGTADFMSYVEYYIRVLPPSGTHDSAVEMIPNKRDRN